MSKDFVCEYTRDEFEMAYEEMRHLNDTESYQYGQPTRYDRPRFCLPELKEQKLGEIEYIYEKFVMPKLLASLSSDVSQSDLRILEDKCPMDDSASLKDEQRQEIINNSQIANGKMKQTKGIDQTTSKAGRTKKRSMKNHVGRAWRAIQNGLVLAGSITATSFLFRGWL